VAKTGKLPLVEPGQLIRILLREGYVLRGHRGTERAYKRKAGGTSRTVIVPTHSKEIKTGTLHSILKQAGWTREEFLALLDKHS
jgi:mRNA interferase HicA